MVRYGFPYCASDFRDAYCFDNASEEGAIFFKEFWNLV